MPFNIQYDADQDCIIVVFTGRVTMQVVRDYLTELLPVLAETGCGRLLSDCLLADIHFSSIDVMQFPKLAAESPLTETLKRAIVAAPGTSGFEMYETMSNLQGQRVRMFADKSRAMEWLLSDED